ncbi:MAG: HPr family phosphocarrier protein [Lachnospiraceae bacterium]|nr:HPr family phosphocarrier protein [Lachnospiraceae bacterium]
MQTFEYKITDEVGLHARPAGLLVKCAKQYKSDIKVEYNGKSASAKALMAIMAMGIMKDAVVTVSVDGEDEQEAFDGVKKFMEENL